MIFQASRWVLCSSFRFVFGIVLAAFDEPPCQVKSGRVGCWVGPCVGSGRVSGGVRSRYVRSGHVAWVNEITSLGRVGSGHVRVESGPVALCHVSIRMKKTLWRGATLPPNPVGSNRVGSDRAGSGHARVGSGRVKCWLWSGLSSSGKGGLNI